MDDKLAVNRVCRIDSRLARVRPVPNRKTPMKRGVSSRKRAECNLFRQRTEWDGVRNPVNV